MKKGMGTKSLNKKKIWRHVLLQNNACGVVVLEMKQKIAKLCCEGRQPRNLVTVMSPEYRFQMQETCLHDDWLDLLLILEVIARQVNLPMQEIQQGVIYLVTGLGKVPQMSPSSCIWTKNCVSKQAKPILSSNLDMVQRSNIVLSTIFSIFSKEHCFFALQRFRITRLICISGFAKLRQYHTSTQQFVLWKREERKKPRDRGTSTSVM